jgi:hypothetical protein
MASDNVWAELATVSFPLRLKSESHRARLASRKAAQTATEKDPVRRLFQLIDNVPHDDDTRKQVAETIKGEQFPANDDHGRYAIMRANESFPVQTRTALLHRIQAGLPVPYGTGELLEDAPTTDDDFFAAAALDKTTPETVSRFAFTLIGRKTVGQLMDQLFSVNDVVCSKGQQLDEPTREEFWRLKRAILASRRIPFIEALLDRARSGQPDRVALMAELIASHNEGEGNMLALPEALHESLTTAIEYWINVMLTSVEANRHHYADVARAIERFPDSRFTSGLQGMLERDLTAWAQAREELKTSQRRGPLPPDAMISHTLEYRRAFPAIGGPDVVALMKQWLPDLQFGVDAAWVLYALWKKDNGPVKETRFGGWYDFSDVKANRARRSNENSPPATSDSGEAIFAVSKRLGLNKSDSDVQRQAIQLASVALRLPHGSKRTEIDALMNLPLPFSAKRGLLTAAAEAGEVIRSEDLLGGVRELMEEAKNQPWRMDKNSSELMGWVELFPFSDRPNGALEVLDAIPEQHPNPSDFDRLLLAAADAPENDALQLLKALADRDKRFLDNYRWTKAIFRIGTAPAANLLIDLIYSGDLPRSGTFWTRQLAELASAHPSIHAKILELYGKMPLGKSRSLLESVLLESPDSEVVLALVRNYAQHRKPFDGKLAHAISETAVGRHPVADWPGAYKPFSVQLSNLRKELFKMALANNSESALGSAGLNEIEELRDEYGRISEEPRHPDISLGRPWPKEAEETAGK